MKLCLSSRSFARALESGDLTQLEWIDLCSAQPALDGVDLSVEHFPRRDDEYVAQIKKLCVDRCLTVAALNSSTAFGLDVDADVDQIKAALDMASGAGAPIVRFSCGAPTGSPGVAWRELIRGLKYAAAHAKLRNVTLAVQPQADTLIATDADVKRALKECDSAWLRLAQPASAPWEALERDAVIMVLQPDVDDLASALRFRGFVSLEDASGGSDAALLAGWIERLAAG